MKLFLRRNAPLFYSLGAMLALYIPWLNRGYNNYEYLFVYAARALSSSADATMMDAYWVSANPLGYSLIVAVFYRVFGFEDVFWISRIPALLGAILILIAGWLMTKNLWRERRHNFYFWAVLMVLHPMIAVFSTSGTTDILPVGLLMFSIALIFVIGEQKAGYILLIAMIFGFAVIIKYNTAYFGLALISAALISRPKFTKNNFQRFRDISIFILVPGIILLAYVYWCFDRFEVFISSRYELSEPHFFDLVGLSKNFAKYISFFGMFCGALPLTLLYSRQRRFGLGLRGIVLSVALTLIGWLSSGQMLGEMDYGRFFEGNYMFFFRLIETGSFVLGVFALITIFSGASSATKTVITWGFFPYLILISASYPSQRYLTFAIPGAVLLLTSALDDLPKKVRYFAVGSTALGFAAVSLLGMSYLTSQGNASEEMAVWVEENNLISQTSAGAIGPHAGQHFWGVKTTELRYEIIAVTPATESQVQERVLHREPMKVLGKVTRVYLLRELPNAP